MTNNNVETTDFIHIRPLTTESDSPILVQETSTQNYYVLKKYPKSMAEHLLKIQQIQSAYLPKIKAIIQDNDHLAVYEEYIEGSTLYQILQKYNTLQENMIIKMASEILSVLALFHAQNFIHRDLKTSNIIYSKEGIWQLIDFDAVRFYDEKKENDTVNLGTVGFAAPEQYGFKQTDARTDIYALGIVMHVSLTGHYPNGEILDKHLSLAPIIQKATAFDPNQRYQSATEMQTTLNTLQNKTNKTTTKPVKQSVTKIATKQSQKVVVKNQPVQRFFWWLAVVIAIFFAYISYLVSVETQGHHLQAVFYFIVVTLIFQPIPFAIIFYPQIKKLPFIKEKQLAKKITGWLLLILIWFILLVIFAQPA